MFVGSRSGPSARPHVSGRKPGVETFGRPSGKVGRPCHNQVRQVARSGDLVTTRFAKWQGRETLPQPGSSCVIKRRDGNPTDFVRWVSTTHRSHSRIVG